MSWIARDARQFWTSGDTFMTNLLRTTAALAALSLATAPAFAAPSDPVGPTGGAANNAKASAKIVKPLTLVATQDLSLGTILLVGTAAYNATVSLAHDGTWSCSNTNVDCSGTHQVAKYKVTGTNNQVVTINAGNVTLTNANDSTKTLLMTTSNPGTMNLGNTGSVGTEFSLGGAITVADTTADGTYNGIFNVTVNY